LPREVPSEVEVGKCAVEVAADMRGQLDQLVVVATRHERIAIWVVAEQVADLVQGGLDPLRSGREVLTGPDVQLDALLANGVVRREVGEHLQQTGSEPLDS